MKIHEYQAKNVLRKFGIVIPEGYPCFNVEDVTKVLNKLSSKKYVIKAQIHAGGRGKGGGVKIANSQEEAIEHATNILGMNLITHQTDSSGQRVKRLLIEEGIEIVKEYYLGIVIDRSTQKVCLMGSSEGGVDIETVAENTPEKIHKIFVNPEVGITKEEAEQFANKIGIPKFSLKNAVHMFLNLYTAFWDTDASLAEINPLVLTKNGEIVALDAKMNFDENALPRQEKIRSLRDLDEEDPNEIEASKYDLSYITLNGSIGCLVNGAGLAMATMDTIKLYGAEPANFLDVGGGASSDKVAEAFKIMLRNPNLKAILVNIFGGIMKCDVIAAGIVNAVKQVKLKVPLVVRMKGTNEKEGREILSMSGLPIISANSMSQAAKEVVKVTKEGN